MVSLWLYQAMNLTDELVVHSQPPEFGRYSMEVDMMGLPVVFLCHNGIFHNLPSCPCVGAHDLMEGSQVIRLSMLVPTGWKPNQRFACFYHGVGVGWGGVGWVDNVHLHFVTYMMLRYCASHIWCYVTVWGGVGWGGVITFSCTSSHIWCYVIVPHIYDATLLCLKHMMLRCCNIVLDCLSSQIWCYAAVISSCTSAHICFYAL